MVAVRREQRQEAERYLRLRWTSPKLARKDEDGVEAEPRRVGSRDMKKICSVGKYKFTEVEQPGTQRPGSKEDACHKSKGSRSGNLRSREEVEGTQDAAQQAVSFRSELAPSEPDLIERLGGGRRDPFVTYPVPFSNELNELVDHCKSSLPKEYIALPEVRKSQL